jgi:hypothetical protein
MRLVVFVEKPLQKQNPRSYHERNPSSFRSQAMTIKKRNGPNVQHITSTMHTILLSDFSVTNTMFPTMQEHKNYTDYRYDIIFVVLSKLELTKLPHQIYLHFLFSSFSKNNTVH